MAAQRGSEDAGSRPRGDSDEASGLYGRGTTTGGSPPGERDAEGASTPDASMGAGSSRLPIALRKLTRGVTHLMRRRELPPYLFDGLDHVYHDMHAPLSHYFISSGHNSYLTRDQVVGDSGTATIIRSLKGACRLIELDCYNGGPDGPICKHGGTATKPVLFRDCIVAIREHAFEASPYPVIITLENHTDAENQVPLVRILKDELGDQLFVPPPGQHQEWLSPESLKHKFLIRTKTKNAIDALIEIVYIAITKFRGFAEMNAIEHVTSSSIGEAKVDTLLKSKLFKGGLHGRFANGASVSLATVPSDKKLTPSPSLGLDDQSQYSLQQRSLPPVQSQQQQQQPPLATASISQPPPLPSPKQQGQDQLQRLASREAADAGRANGDRSYHSTSGAVGEAKGVDRASEGGTEGTATPRAAAAGSLTGATQASPAGASGPTGPASPFARTPLGALETQRAVVGPGDSSCDVSVSADMRGQDKGSLGQPCAPRVSGAVDRSTNSAAAPTASSAGGATGAGLSSLPRPASGRQGISAAAALAPLLTNGTGPPGPTSGGLAAASAPPLDRQVTGGEAATTTNRTISMHDLPFDCRDVFSYTSRHLLRVYPASWKVDSRNFDPTVAWGIGTSCVALNWQHWDRAMWVNQGKFRDNGGCGYVKKPQWMLDAATEGLPERPPSMLSVHIREAFKPRGGLRFMPQCARELLSIHVKIRGMPEDASKQITTAEKNTGKLRFDKTFEFQVVWWEVAVLLIILKQDKQALGYFSAPLATLKAGRYKLGLLRADGEPLDHCYIKVQFAWDVPSRLRAGPMSPIDSWPASPPLDHSDGPLAAGGMSPRAVLGFAPYLTASGSEQHPT